MNARLKSHPARFRTMSEADVDNIMAIELMAYPFPWTAQIFTDCIRAGYACFVLPHPGRPPAPLPGAR
jgi:ribosomal-protein-alanine N-acetyltransferase